MSVAAVAAVVGAGATAYGASQIGSGGKTISTFNYRQKSIADMFGKWLAHRQGEGEQYQGGLTAPLNPLFGMSGNMFSQYNPGMLGGAQTSALRRQLSGAPAYQVNMDPKFIASNYDKSVTQPAMRTFDTQIAPRINEGFAGVGAFSSRQGDAKARALGDLSSQLSSGLGQAQLSNYQWGNSLNAQMADSAAGRVGPALQNLLAVQGAPIGAGSAMMGAAGQLQGFQNLGAQGQYQEWLRTRPENSPYNNLILQFLGMPTQALDTSNPGAQIGAAGLQTLLQSMMVMSDKNKKLSPDSVYSPPS